MLKPNVSHTSDQLFCMLCFVYHKVLSQLNSCKPETAFICSLFHADLSESLWILWTSTCTSRLFWAAWTEIAEFFYSFCGLCTSVIRNSDGKITQMESKNMVSAGINSTRHGWQSQNTKTRSDVRGSCQLSIWALDQSHELQRNPALLRRVRMRGNVQVMETQDCQMLLCPKHHYWKSVCN